MPAALIIGIGPARPKKGGGPLFGSQRAVADRGNGPWRSGEEDANSPPDFSSLMGSHAEDRGSRPSVSPMGSANQKSSAAQVTSEPRPSFSEDETANPSQLRIAQMRIPNNERAQGSRIFWPHSISTCWASAPATKFAVPVSTTTVPACAAAWASPPPTPQSSPTTAAVPTLLRARVVQMRKPKR